MSGGTLMVWLRVCSASIGVPAAIRPITGTETGRLESSSEPPLLPLGRTLPRLPSMTLGVKPRRPLPPLLPDSSGSFITSMARARLGRRRMKPRSSSAVIRRWMPDLERRSSASFISSKEGGTPASFSRSLMNRRSSYCLRVSISTNPQFASLKLDDAVQIPKGAPTLRSRTPVQARILETNHERTLYVPYVFRNHLISRQQNKVLHSVARKAVGRWTGGQLGRARRIAPLQGQQSHDSPVSPADASRDQADDSSGKCQAKKGPGSASRHSGSSSAQREAARGHRVRKRQPLGGFMGEGNSPASSVKASWR